MRRRPRTLKEFLESDLKNAWIENSKLRVYLRKGFHSIDGEIVSTLDVANVVVPESKRNQGIFRDFMREVEMTGYSVFVESVLNDWLPRALERRGYRVVSDVAVVSLFKRGTSIVPW